MECLINKNNTVKVVDNQVAQSNSDDVIRAGRYE